MFGEFFGKSSFLTPMSSSWRHRDQTIIHESMCFVMQVSVLPSLPVKRVVSGRWLSCCFKICHRFGPSNAERFELLLKVSSWLLSRIFQPGIHLYTVYSIGI